MNLLLRFFGVIFKARFASPVDFFAESQIGLRVWLNDIDVIGHMNNGRYLSMMDLGRMDFLIRAHMMKKLRAKKYYPVVASAMVRYKKSLLLHQKFILTTQLLGWDDRFFYMLHKMVIKQNIYNISIVKIRFLHKGQGSIDTAPILDAMGLADKASPVLPNWVIEWNRSDKEMHDEVAK